MKGKKLLVFCEGCKFYSRIPGMYISVVGKYYPPIQRCKSNPIDKITPIKILKVEEDPNKKNIHNNCREFIKK